MGKSKFPNGYGGITKLSGNRTKPYMAYKTTGWDENGNQIKEPIGYKETYEKALSLLINYNKKCYNIKNSKMTYGQACKNVIKQLECQYKEGTFSKKSLELYKASLKKHTNLIAKIPLTELKKKDIEDQIKACDKGYSTKKYIKSLATKVYDYCINDLEIEPKKFAYKLNCGQKTKSDLHKPFTENEINILWKNINIEYIDTILIMIYTGIRPTEMFITENSKIHLEENFFITGIKTLAGMNRTIPIHHRIKIFFENRYSINKKWFLTTEGNRQMWDKKYAKIFASIMKQLDMDHLPYDCRHTFATRMDKNNANKLCRKLIMGHEVKDITDGVYTHKTLEDLLIEIEKLP